MAARGDTAISRSGWRFIVSYSESPSAPESRERLVELTLAAASGSLERCVRRSRRAETWVTRIGGPDNPLAYFKVLDPAPGFAAIRRRLRLEGAHRVAAISKSLRSDGFDVPEVLLIGFERAGGREMIVTRRIEGAMPPRFLRERQGGLAGKRAMLRALGAEVARLHRTGYLHGDLTPYNLLITAAAPPRFAFIDHERTRRTIRSRFERMRLRNLVQLGHSNLPNLTNSDRMRVWAGYAATIAPAHRRAALRRAVALIRARMTRERARAAAQPAIMPRRREAEGG
ncbi:MAG: lipopolysaccharide kinase InaA family protein [Candidatus Binataceae bacterium]